MLDLKLLFRKIELRADERCVGGSGEPRPLIAEPFERGQMIIGQGPVTVRGVDFGGAPVHLCVVLGGCLEVHAREGNRQKADRCNAVATAERDLGAHAPEKADPFERAVIGDQLEGCIDRRFRSLQIRRLDFHIGEVVEDPGFQDRAFHPLGQLDRLGKRGFSLLEASELGQGIGHVVMGCEVERVVLIPIEGILKILDGAIVLLCVRVDGRHGLQCNRLAAPIAELPIDFIGLLIVVERGSVLPEHFLDAPERGVDIGEQLGRSRGLAKTVQGLCRKRKGILGAAHPREGFGLQPPCGCKGHVTGFGKGFGGKCLGQLGQRQGLGWIGHHDRLSALDGVLVCRCGNG